MFLSSSKYSSKGKDDGKKEVPQQPKPPSSNHPVLANFSSERLTIGCGVAIFHIASQKVVVCYHTRDRYWFLPKGRRDAGENFGQAAEREGYEESGYRNRLLPLPVRHTQPKPYAPDPTVPVSPFVVEPVWTQLAPVAARTQYLLFWFIAETLPPEVERDINSQTASLMSTMGTEEATHPDVTGRKIPEPYVNPPPYPMDLKLKDRIALESPDYLPQHHENTGVDEDESYYQSFLLPIAEAISKINGPVQQDVIRKGWHLIQMRRMMEGESIGGETLSQT